MSRRKKGLVGGGMSPTFLRSFRLRQQLVSYTVLPVLKRSVDDGLFSCTLVFECVYIFFRFLDHIGIRKAVAELWRRVFLEVIGWGLCSGDWFEKWWHLGSCWQNAWWMVASSSYHCVLCVTVPVLAASINPKLASTLIRWEFRIVKVDMTWFGCLIEAAIFRVCTRWAETTPTIFVHLWNAGI